MSPAESCIAFGLDQNYLKEDRAFEEDFYNEYRDWAWSFDTEAADNGQSTDEFPLLWPYLVNC